VAAADRSCARTGKFGLREGVFLLAREADNFAQELLAVKMLPATLLHEAFSGQSEVA